MSMQKSWHLNRRTFLRGTGVSLALPWLEAMSFGAEKTRELPRRLAFIYFPHGVSHPQEGTPDFENWNWFPSGEGHDYRMTQTMAPLEGLRDELTIVGGLSHPLGRLVPGHKAGDVYLTGADVSGAGYEQSISADQVAARTLGNDTRLPSLVMSTAGGVNRPLRSYTLSYDSSGRPIPAMSKPREIYSLMFDSGQNSTEERRRFAQDSVLLDRLLEDARSLKRNLGKQDQERLEEYLDSVRDVEARVKRAEEWLDIPKPALEEGVIDLDVSPEGAQEFVRSMYDLQYLAFVNDSTRISTYQFGGEGDRFHDKFPQLIGMKRSSHGLSHTKGSVEWAQYNQWTLDQFAYFVNRLKSTPEGDGTLLDRTLILHGSCTSKTHYTRNYPLILAGGKSMGVKHGRFLKYSDDVPMSNLLVSMMRSAGAEVESFKDSTGELEGLKG